LGKAEDLVRPGHIFPLIAKNGGVLIRTGHTEGSVDLCRLAGLRESAVICEIMKDNGEMARRDDLMKFAEKHNLKIVYISDIVEYRLQNEKLIKLISFEKIDMLESQADKYIFQDHLNREHIAIRFYQPRKTANVRFHHIGSDVDLITNSKKYQMLMKSTNYLIKNSGVLIFLNSSENSGENIKEFGIGAQILKELGISEIKLIQESKREIEFVGIQGFGLNLKEVINL
jgi:3,4-dihydroxy 2-butanone 4-phosphate synthase/GTP cyclohydrolase II